MKKFRENIENFLVKYNINNPELTYLVAFSGGYDSMCLLDILKKTTKNRIVAIHLNHNWRGEESDNEELNCKNFCEQIGVEFYSQRLSDEISHTETAAREARYDFFENCAKKFNSRIVFTAHNKNDNAETLIYRIASGTGVAGLCGIQENRGIYYRPLLGVSRCDIENYCRKYHLNPNNDSSNSDTKYKRNLIRAKILPELEKINPNVIDAIGSLSEIAREETEIIEQYLSGIFHKITDGGKLRTDKFLKLSASVQNRIIYQMLVLRDLDYDKKKIIQIREFICDNQNSKSGKTFSLTSDLWIFASEKYIEIISKSEPCQMNLHITKEGIYETGDFIFEIEKFSKPVKKFPKDDENIAYVNLGKTEFDFDLRCRQDGDKIRPYGMRGSQKLKKYFNSKGIPNHEKDKLFLLAQGQEILWVPGFGISDRIKVISEATHRLKFIKKEV